MALSTHVRVTMLIYSSKTTSSYPLNPLIFTPQEIKRCLETFSQSGIGLKWLLSSPFISDHIHSIWKLFYHTSLPSVSCQTRSFKSTPLSLPAGWIFISYQSKLMTSSKIFTCNSKPDISISASAVDLVGNQLCMQDPNFCEYSTQQVGLSTSFSYKYSHCFERSVGPNNL